MARRVGSRFWENAFAESGQAPYNDAVHLFGLTGGIASGKSAVARVFSSEGVSVVDADVVAREVVALETPGIKALEEAFGKSILTPAGELDRKKLAAIVFPDPALRAKLNGILHPRIAARSAERFREETERGASLVCYDAALIVENGLADSFRPLVVVDAPVEIRVARARARDAASGDEIEARIRAQAPSAEKRALADFVIDNLGTLDALEARAKEVLGEIRTRLGL